MAWPTGTALITTHLDAGSDDPSQARAALLAAVQDLKSVIDMLGVANGPANLDSTGKITTSQLPVVPITKGGTGATTAAAARTALGIPTFFGQTVFPVDMYLPGLVETITSTNKARAIRESHLFISMRCFAVEVEGIESIDNNATQPTVICVSNQAPDENNQPVAGSYITLSLDPTDGQASIVGQALDCTGGYVFAWCIDASGGHVGIKLRIWMQSLTS